MLSLYVSTHVCQAAVFISFIDIHPTTRIPIIDIDHLGVPRTHHIYATEQHHLSVKAGKATGNIIRAIIS